MSKAVFFDIGGVLERTPTDDWRLPWASRLGLSLEAFQSRLSRTYRGGEIGRITEDQFEAAVKEEFHLDAPTLDRLLKDLWDDYLGSPNSDLIRYFESLRSRCKTGIISNSFVGAREREQRRYGFEGFCDRIFYSHELGVSKPDPTIYEIACAAFEVEASQALLLDDVHENVAAARSFGMRAVLFDDNATAIGEIGSFLNQS